MPGIFINYRREDSGGYAQQIYRALRAHFGAKLVFMDIDTIRSGEDYRAIIRDAIAQSDVFLAIIGRSWLTVTDAQGNRRLQLPADLVRHEVSQALAAKILVIPVLVGHAPMPRADSLPDDLKPLVARNAHDIPDKFFDQSVRQLIQTIRPYVRGKQPISRRAILYGVGGTAAVMLAAAIADSAFKSRVPIPEGARTNNLTPEDLKNVQMEVLIDDAGKQPAVVVRKPGKVSALPSEVAGPWKIDRINFDSQVTGPQQLPKVVWTSRASVRDAWKLIGFAPDQTLFLYDREMSAISAIKDGTERWASSAGQVFGITPDGLIVLEEQQLVLPYGSTFLCFNSRGEGGICQRPLKQPSDLMHWSSDSYGSTIGVCEGGAVTLTRSKSVVQLDGNCASWGLAHDDQGRIYAGTDRGTLYCFSADGRTLWSYKAEAPGTAPPLFSQGDAVFVAKDHLICVREGTERWRLQLDWCQPRLVDKSGTIFVTHRPNRDGRIDLNTVSAIDRDGHLLWSLPTPGEPAALDPLGRLYLVDPSKGFVLCLA